MSFPPRKVVGSPDMTQVGCHGKTILSEQMRLGQEKKNREKKNRGIAHMIKRIFIWPLLILVICSFVYAEGENYCRDKESWKEWDALVEKNPNDMEVQALHALRIGLCAKVDRGGITLEQATRIFESIREGLVEKRKADHKREKDRQKLESKTRDRGYQKGRLFPVAPLRRRQMKALLGCRSFTCSYLKINAALLDVKK
jgi:hypothetical protein